MSPYRVNWLIARIGARSADGGAFVVEDAEGPDLGGEVGGLLGGVVVGDAEEDQQAGAVDRADDLDLDADTLAWLTRCTTALIVHPAAPEIVR